MIKLKQLLTVLFLVSILLTACAPSASPSGAAATPSPSATDRVIPTVIPQPTETPVSTPKHSATPAAPAEQSQVPPAAIAAQKALADQLGLNADQVKVLSAEAMDWPNGCSGVQMPGRMCTQMITPGFRVMLEAKGQQFEYHTNLNGETVLPAVSKLPQTADKVVVWEQTQGAVCSRAEIGTKSVAFGPCAGPLTEADLDPSRSRELADLLATYQNFSAGTQAGTVQFNGQGQQKPTAAEMRSVSEWSRLVFMEAQGGRTGAAWGLAFAWHQEGGIAGLCNDLAVSVTGWATSNSCKPGNTRSNPAFRLTADELAKMYSWVDTYKNFEYGQKDNATADAMKQTLIFTGTGATVPTPEQQAEVSKFAAQIFTEATR